MKQFLPLLLIPVLLAGCTKAPQLTAEELQSKKDSCYALVATVMQYEFDLYPDSGHTSQVDWMIYHQPTDACYYAGEATLNYQDQESETILYITKVSTLKPIYHRIIGGPNGLPRSTYAAELETFTKQVQSMRAGKPL